jgi:hypothetical protein
MDFYDRMDQITNTRLRRIGYKILIRIEKWQRFIIKVEFLLWLARLWWFQPRHKWTFTGECRFGTRLYLFWAGAPLKWERVGESEIFHRYLIRWGRERDGSDLRPELKSPLGHSLFFPVLYIVITLGT